MVDGEHDGAARRRIEGAGEAVLHAPVELVAALQKKSGRRLRRVGLIALAFLVGFGHSGFPWLLIGRAND